MAMPRESPLNPPSFPSAEPPERSRRVKSLGVSLQVHEWGDPDATPIVLIFFYWPVAIIGDVFLGTLYDLDPRTVTITMERADDSVDGPPIIEVTIRPDGSQPDHLRVESTAPVQIRVARQ